MALPVLGQYTADAACDSPQWAQTLSDTLASFEKTRRRSRKHSAAARRDGKNLELSPPLAPAARAK
jgi:hypothetical protein